MKKPKVLTTSDRSGNFNYQYLWSQNFGRHAIAMV